MVTFIKLLLSTSTNVKILLHFIQGTPVLLQFWTGWDLLASELTLEVVSSDFPMF